MQKIDLLDNKQGKRRIILTEHERDLVRMIDYIKLELKLSALVNTELGKEPYDLKRIMDLLNLKDMLLSSILKRSKLD